MTSKAEGYLIVPVWSDGGVIKPLADDNGRIVTQLGGSDITLNINIKTSDITVDVEEQSPLTSIEGQSYGYDGSTWRKNNLVWGYNDRWLEQVNATVTVAGWNFLETAAVPSGYVYVLAAYAAVNQTRDPTSIMLGINISGARYYVKRTATPGANIYVDWSVAAPFKVGDKALAAIEGCQIGDILTFNVWGYKMKVNM
jgi:hypothetical protein